MATEIEILRMLKILGDVYPKYQLSSSAIDVYIRLLADIPGSILEQSTLDHIGRSTFFPSIAELRSAAFSIIEASHPIPNEYEAWSEVQAEIQRVGHCNKPHFDNPITARVVEQLGWRTLCLSDNVVADRAHFIQAYQALSERERISNHRLQMVADFIVEMNGPDHPKLTDGKEKRIDPCQPTPI